MQPVDPGIAAWTLGVVVKGLGKHLKHIQLHHQAFKSSFSCQDFPKFSLTHFIDITSLGGNGGQQQQAPAPAIVQPVDPGIDAWSFGMIMQAFPSKVFVWGM